ncbi:MAG: glycosyltransferase [Chthoniobacterales bacterium]|nr:glycosyltransferase [Chthoniobacterales bacterium]
MISLITPSLNQLEWLQLCAASVADQKVELEHIVQDAGSGPELRSWAAEQTNLRLFIEKDEGMYDAINRGLRRATGDICAYLNCDEQYLPGALAKVDRFFATHPGVDVLFGDFILVDTAGNPLSYRRVVLPTLQHLRLAPLGTGSCATFFRRSLLERGFYFDPQWKASGDAVWVEALLKAKVRMAVMREAIAVFTFTGENLGGAAAARREGGRRRGPGRRYASLRRAIALLAYRLRKIRAGAYRTRSLAVEIYRLDSPQKRQRKVAGNVGFAWPSP